MGIQTPYETALTYVMTAKFARTIPSLISPRDHSSWHGVILIACTLLVVEFCDLFGVRQAVCSRRYSGISDIWQFQPHKGCRRCEGTAISPKKPLSTPEHPKPPA